MEQVWGDAGMLGLQTNSTCDSHKRAARVRNGDACKSAAASQFHHPFTLANSELSIQGCTTIYSFPVSNLQSTAVLLFHISDHDDC
jgi:hypothetical protein